MLRDPPDDESQNRNCLPINGVQASPLEDTAIRIRPNVISEERSEIHAGNVSKGTEDDRTRNPPIFLNSHTFA
jgi:hypothetical protein